MYYLRKRHFWIFTKIPPQDMRPQPMSNAPQGISHEQDVSKHAARDILLHSNHQRPR